MKRKLLLFFLCVSFYAHATMNDDKVAVRASNMSPLEKEIKRPTDKPPFALPTATCPSLIINGAPYNFILAQFGATSFNVTGEVVLVDNGDENGGCATITTNLTGKIALISRGQCPSQFKAQRAQNAGAVGVIIYNPADGNFNLSGVQPTLTIPVVGLLRADANAVIAALGMGTVSATLYTNLPKPTLSPATSPAICPGATSFTIPYTATVGSPNTYSISGADITTVTDAPLPANAITVNLSSGATGSSISYTLTVKNSDDCVSDNIMGSVAVNPAPTRLYVNAAATGANTGLTWTDAFTDLQSALNYTCNASLTEIWVAAGTYKPHASDKNISFSMKNGVSILGGFPNDGSGTLANRNWAANPTILSGDLNGDDTFTGTGTNLVIGNNSDNSYLVIRNGNTLDNTARLDGFIVSGANNTISGSLGGGIFNDGRNGTCNPVFVNCIFRHNLASSGGAVANDGDNGTCNPSFTHCLFYQNQAIYNSAGSYAGAMWCFGNVNTVLSHCTFSQNKALGNGGAIIAERNFGRPNVSLRNCILWDNTANRSGNQVFIAAAILNLHHALLQGGTGAIGTSFTNTINDNGGLLDAAPLFVDANGGNYRLQACSPAINAGDPATTSATVGSVDLANNPRFYNGGTVDMGAYEYQGALFAATARSNSPVCIGGVLNLSATGGSAYSWVGPNGYSSVQQNPTRSNATTSISGVYSVTVTEGACTATASTSVVVQQSQGSANLSSNSPVCAGSALNLSATGGSAYTWAGPGGYSSTLQNPRRAAANVVMSGTYSATVRNSGGCSTTVSTSVVVSPNVAPSITSLRVNGNLPNAQTNTVTACTNAPVTLTVAATNAVTYSWRGPTGAGSGFTSSLASPVEMPIASPRQGQYTVTVRNGCQVFNQRVINIQLINCSNTRLANAEDTEAIEMEINAYPNPVSKTLRVEVRLKEPAAVQLKLLNSVGQTNGTWQLSEVRNFHQTELNLADLQGGVYLLEAQAGSQRAVKRVVKMQYE